MKKNFVKKLALGLALVMTVTSVPVSSEAAAKPAFKTASVEVKEGETVKAVVKGTKGYKVKKVASKNEEVAKVVKFAQKAKKTNVKVTGVKAGETKVVAKLVKGGKTVKAKLAVTVKAEEKATMTVEATGVKEITVKFNKAVDTASKIVVKKGTSAPSFEATWAADAKSVVLAMGSKLTEGTYDITVGEVTGSVSVVDEVISSIEFVGNNLVYTVDADDNTENKGVALAEIEYKTLNQYGERMTDPGEMNVATSFGKVEDGDLDGCTVKKNGTITVSISAEILQIIGTTGTITIIDNTKGVTATAEVTLSAKATPKTMTVVGLMNTTTEKMEDMYRGCDPSEYFVLVQIKDQYDNVLDKDAVVAAEIDPNFVAGTTGLTADETLANWVDGIEINGEDYLGIPFAAGEAKVGTFYFTFVNPSMGLLANASFTVSDSTVVKSVNVYANDTIYDGTRTELGFEAVDVNGNAITKYEQLADTITFELATKDSGSVDWEKQADGTAKLVYTPGVGHTADNGKGKELVTLTVTANSDVPTSLIVKTVNFTVNQAKVAKAVVGISSKAYTAVATGAGIITVKATDLLIEDQYSNVMSADEIAGVTIKAEVVDGALTLSDSTFVKGTDLTIKPAGAVSGTVAYKLERQTEAYEVKYSVVDPMKATNLSMTVNDGYMVYAAATAPAVTVVPSTIEVVGTVSGKKVVIPVDNNQYVISGNTGVSAIDPNKEPQTTKTATLEVTVDTNNGPVVLTSEYKYSNTTPIVSEMSAGKSYTASAGTLTATELAGLFYMYNQYGSEVGSEGAEGATVTSNIKYTIIDVSPATIEGVKIAHNTTNSVAITAPADSKFIVTATVNGVTATTKVTVGNVQ